MQPVFRGSQLAKKTSTGKKKKEKRGNTEAATRAPAQAPALAARKSVSDKPNNDDKPCKSVARKRRTPTLAKAAALAKVEKILFQLALMPKLGLAVPPALMPPVCQSKCECQLEQPMDKIECSNSESELQDKEGPAPESATAKVLLTQMHSPHLPPSSTEL
jgi:hypothetical protein